MISMLIPPPGEFSCGGFPNTVPYALDGQPKSKFAEHGEGVDEYIHGYYNTIYTECHDSQQN